MRYWEIIDEDMLAPSTITPLLQQAKIKQNDAKKLKKQASVQKKRDQVNKARTSLLKKQSDLSKTISKPIL